eukprot:3027504-Pyramimonas_sp.AAC.1
MAPCSPRRPRASNRQPAPRPPLENSRRPREIPTVPLRGRPPPIAHGPPMLAASRRFAPGVLRMS